MCYCGTLPTIYWESEPIARKQHICCECGSFIDEDEKYYKIKGVWDGEFETYKQCMVCRKVWLKALDEMPIPECICYGELWDTFGHLYEKVI